MSWTELAAAVQAVGVVGLLLGALVGLHRQWWHPGWVVKELLAAKDQRIRDVEGDRDDWKRLALRGAATSSRATKVADRVADLATPNGDP